MTKRTRFLAVVCVGALTIISLALGVTAWAARSHDEIPLEESRIFFEYNSTDNDLGVQVALDGESWKTIRIVGPDRRKIFEVAGKGSLRKTGLTELSFEGEEPSLDEVPVDEFLACFPEGAYKFLGKTVEGDNLMGIGTLTHAVPAGPSNVSAVLNPDHTVVISWSPVTSSAASFPERAIEIAGYQVIVGSFQVSLPGSSTSVTVSPEFVQSLASGEQGFEVLAIEAGGNQTITQGSFTTP